MGRRSKRELERATNRLEQTTNSVSEETVYDRLGEPLGEFCMALARSLTTELGYSIDECVNGPDDAANHRFFEVVRDEYGISVDRDQAVIRTLEDVGGAQFLQCWEKFPFLPGQLLDHCEVESKAGESVRELVEAGRCEEAEAVLVRATYDWLAGDEFPRGGDRR